MEIGPDKMKMITNNPDHLQREIKKRSEARRSEELQDSEQPSSMTAMSKPLDQPSRKFFLKDLQSCSEENLVNASCSADSGKMKNWQFKLEGVPVHFCITWIQGVVVEVLESHDSFFLDDGTGVVLVTGYSKIPFATTKPQLGDYMMVVGPLLKSGVCPVVKTMKIQNLNNNRSLEAMWCLEVIDQPILSNT